MNRFCHMGVTQGGYGADMEQFKRFAVYYAPPEGDFADVTARWLGWDLAKGRAVPGGQPLGLPRAREDLTRGASVYGFHGTLKAPFRLAPGVTELDLAQGCAALAKEISPVVMPGLRLSNLGGFLALTPLGDETELLDLGAEVVTRLDLFRADLTAQEIARRRPERLTPRQRMLLDQWGYPHVLDEFRFHLTLTDSVPAPDRAAVAEVLEREVLTQMPRPFVIADLCLCAEDQEGRFHLRSRHALGG